MSYRRHRRVQCIRHDRHTYGWNCSRHSQGLQKNEGGGGGGRGGRGRISKCNIHKWLSWKINNVVANDILTQTKVAWVHKLVYDLVCRSINIQASVGLLNRYPQNAKLPNVKPSQHSATKAFMLNSYWSHNGNPISNNYNSRSVPPPPPL